MPDIDTGLTNPPQLNQLVDNPLAPAMFADMMLGTLINNGNIQLTFAAVRPDHTRSPPTTHMVVVGRVILPLPALEAMAGMLSQTVQNLKATLALSAPVTGPAN